jgi:HSP20 family protein
MYRWRADIDPWRSEMGRFRREMDTLFGALDSETAPRRSSLWRESRLFPLLNIVEKGDCFLVTTELPGIDVEDLELLVEGDTLTLKGARRPTQAGPDASYHRRERATGPFQRSVTLPGSFDAEQVKANYRDGVLSVALIKARKAVAKQVKISGE